MTPSVVKALEVLKDHFVVLTMARSVKLANTSFLWDFERIELKALPQPDALRLFHRLTEGLPFTQLEYAQNKVWETSEGNPRMIVELAERLGKEPVLDAGVVEAVCNGYLGRQTREIDISPYLLVGFGSLLVLRYVGRETGEDELQFLGGCVLVILLFARFFFNRTKQREW